jgi:hypothetical protein
MNQINFYSIQLKPNVSISLSCRKSEITEIFHRLSALDETGIEELSRRYFYSATFALVIITRLGLKSPNPRTVELMKSAILADFTAKILEDNPCQDSSHYKNIREFVFPAAALRAFFNKNHSLHQTVLSEQEENHFLKNECKEEARKTIQYVLGSIDTIQPSTQSDENIILLRDYKNLFNGKRVHKLP